jgi:hypothetical protein
MLFPCTCGELLLLPLLAGFGFVIPCGTDDDAEAEALDTPLGGGV